MLTLKGEAETAAKAAVLGKIGKTHGVKGWLRIVSFTSPVDNILEYSHFSASRDQETQQLEIDEFKNLSAGIVAHIKGYDTPEAARQLTGLTLSVDVSELPALESDEVYWYQLEGLVVVNQHAQVLGRISKILETGANDVLVVDADEHSIDDRQRLIPYRKGVTVIEVDLSGGAIKVQWEADYLE